MGAVASVLSQAGRQINDYYNKAEEAEKIIIRHSGIAGAAAIIPIPYADMAICLPNQIAMYVYLNKEMNVSVSKELLKVIGGFMLSQLTGLISVFPFVIAGKIIGGLAKFLPFGGSLVGILIDGAINSGITYVMGVVYLKAMINVLKAGKSLNEDNLKEALSVEFSNKNEIKKIYKEGRDKLKDIDFSQFKDDAKKYSEDRTEEQANEEKE